MHPAGFYCDRIQILTQSTAKNDQGQDVPTFVAGVTLWGKVDTTGSQRQADFGATRTAAQATITLRGYPAIHATDRILWMRWGETYVISSVYRGDWEMVCDAEKFDGATV